MAKITLLVQGYAKRQGGDERVSSTCVLVEDNDVKIVVDPGMAKDAVLQALLQKGYGLDNVQYVLLTHYHPDHAYYASLFPRAKMLDYGYVYEGDRAHEHDGFVPGTDLAIIRTSGHAPEHCSLAVPTDQGMVVVAGDVFWWYDDEEQSAIIEKHDPFANDQHELEESRKKVLKMADFIIPGHGRMFRVEKKQ